MYILFNWCQGGVQDVFRFVKYMLEVIRIIVPIGLIIMTGIDIFKKVISPDDKDGQKKILNRLLAAIIVFFVPLMVRFVLKLVDIGGGNANGDSSLSSCWRNS